MSIVRYQSRDGSDEKPEWVINNMGFTATWKTPGETTIVVDDIYDSGRTMRAIQQMDEFKQHPNVIYQCLFGSKNKDGVGFLNERISRWIVFPWERSTGAM
jgi:hypoxanthine phosphoribosyltransferase